MSFVLIWSPFVFLFVVRCLLWDKEFSSREKDSEIRELKQKIVNLSGMLKKSEAQKAELIHEVKFVVYFIFLDLQLVEFPCSFVVYFHIPLLVIIFCASKINNFS